ncbi:hypothetical protein AFM12_03340 [Jiulongibacter sediminis]|uniref:Uncharacterized protein n=2 Tax=Jiulongibacter sediminis TaxID=1605367 RepID=A0A0P7C4N8_9BACT|nr:hypothetical protein AFM12_03340 [Jiulongibacter sediminis]TBX26678.1 hypothetical protein TK44_03345 [Jiulongibacter sediminis]
MLLTISFFSLQSCEDLGDIFEDTDLNPIYFVECKLNGETYRAQTNNNAWLSWSAFPGEGGFDVTSNISSEDKIFNFNSFASLGATKVPVGTVVNSYLTNITYFVGDLDYSALETGGSGYVDFEVLEDDYTEGTFEATLVNRKDLDDKIEVTEGVFKVKTR